MAAQARLTIVFEVKKIRLAKKLSSISLTALHTHMNQNLVNVMENRKTAPLPNVMFLTRI